MLLNAWHPHGGHQSAKRSWMPAAKTRLPVGVLPTTGFQWPAMCSTVRKCPEVVVWDGCQALRPLSPVLTILTFQIGFRE